MTNSKEHKDLHSRPPYARMMYIHDQIRRGAYPNCSQMREHFGLRARETIFRDIEFMRDSLLLPIEYDKQRHGYYYSRPVAHFPGVTVSESELFAILVAQKAIWHLQGKGRLRGGGRSGQLGRGCAAQPPLASESAGHRDAGRRDAGLFPAR